MLHTTMSLGYACNKLGMYWYEQGAWRVVEHVNDWCFCEMYRGSLWEEELDVCALLHEGCKTTLVHDVSMTILTF